MKSYLRNMTRNFLSSSRYRVIHFMIVISGLFIFLYPEDILSQTTDSINSSDSINYFEKCNTIYKSSIKTVLFHRDGWDMSPPLLNFGTDEKLRLSFDDLDGDYKNFTYTITHCDANWKPSAIRQDEYIDGYFEESIRDYSFSINTILPYTHYVLVFPTEDLIPKIPGNYILTVYNEDPDSIFFTRRFMLVDQKVRITGRVHQATQLEEKNYKQEVDFSINANGYRIINPYQDLKVVRLFKMVRWDNAITNLQPKMVIGDKYDYDYDKENVFDGGNEFRAFDIKTLRSNSENVAKIVYAGDGYQVYLRDDEKRTFQVYKTEKDIDGQMKIKTDDRSDSETQAEYVSVHFFLSYPAPMIDADMFILGQLTDWQLSDASKMDYNYKMKRYEKILLLKQGYYNYQYVLRYHGQSAGDATFIEGNHAETENTYTVFVYNREFGGDFDVLIGVDYLSSMPTK